MLSKEQYEKLKYQIAMHKPVSSVVAMSVDGVESLFEMIDKLEENATAQVLALKAAKAMQQAETERADANERDAERYRYIRTKERMVLDTDDGEARMTTTFSSADEFDDAIDKAMEQDK